MGFLAGSTKKVYYVKLVPLALLVCCVFAAMHKLLDFVLSIQGLHKVCRESRSFKQCALLAFSARSNHSDIAICACMHCLFLITFALRRQGDSNSEFPPKVSYSSCVDSVSLEAQVNC